ncbi:heparan-alpha-glucosaminide N-acetyltransferase domain-containing protein [Desulfosporosinus sp. SB140]|uniref:heparan-alpha-glucosaminide N-acetyltransferase domain-containing protein n=1 Tax=Desulfosporosinus paludis TaxID=3115649 RepID=UPI0038904D95
MLRLSFLDRTRGLIMIFMALDHALYFWSNGRVNNEGLPLLVNGTLTFHPLGSTTLLGLLVMFLSSLCAPGFLFIAGYVLALSIKKREATGASDLSIDKYLWKRGLVLIALQLLIASPAFNLPLFIQAKSFSTATIGTFFSLSVLSSIGLGFIVLSFGRRISPWKLLGVTGFLYLLSQAYLPKFTMDFPLLQTLVKACQTVLVLPVPFSPELLVNNNFPLIPWLLPMTLGWLYGQTYTEKRGVSYEANRFAVSGLCSIALFLVLRSAGIGDYLLPDGTMQGFWGLSKYPPSIDYFLLYLGLVFLLFFLFFKLSDTSKIGGLLENFGRAPLFFYNAHLWLYAAIPAVLGHFNALSLLPGTGIWLLGILILYPLTQSYQILRSSHKLRNPRSKLLPRSESISSL